MDEKIIGIIGLSLRRFEHFCRISGLCRLSDKEYTDGKTRFICIDDVRYLYGRHFDYVIDFDPLRIEVNKRMVSKNRYHFGNLANLLKEINDKS